MTPEALRARLASGGELALLDVREQGVHYRGHPFFACSLPLSRLELRVGELVPRKTAPLVLLDGGGEGLAERARRKGRARTRGKRRKKGAKGAVGGGTRG